jgi:hypothetical protein
MNFFSARKLTGEATKEELKCIRCGDRPNIVQVMLDPRRGKTLRMYGAVSAFGTIKADACAIASCQ